MKKKNRVNWIATQSFIGRGIDNSDFPAKLTRSLTFYKNFEWGKYTTKSDTTAKIYADCAIGSRFGTFGRTTDATHPATYIDANGKITSAATGQPRIAGGYYDATGFHSASGLLMEVTSTNLVPKCYTFNDATWSVTNITAANAQTTDPAGGNNAASITATAANGVIYLASAVTGNNLSVYVKRKTGTGSIFLGSGVTWGEFTGITTAMGWVRLNFNCGAGSKQVGILIQTSGDAFYVYGAQHESLGYPTSLIPTTNGALTRNGDTLTYPIAGNRTAETETIAVKFMPLDAFTSGLTYRVLIDNPTKGRWFGNDTGITTLIYQPNYIDTVACSVSSTTTPLANTSYVATAVSYGPTAAKNAEIYMNGVSEGFDNDNYTANAWSGNFSVGGYTTVGQLNGLIQSVAIFNRALSVAEVSQVYEILK